MSSSNLSFFFGLIFILLSYSEFAFSSLNACGYATAAVEKTLRVSPLYYDRGQQVVHSGLSYWVEGRGVHYI